MSRTQSTFQKNPEQKYIIFQMRLRIIIEIAILAAFVIAALVIILVRNPDAPGAGSGRRAEEYIKMGNRLYATGRSKFSEASIQYWEAIKLNPDMAEPHFKLATIYYEHIWNHQTLRELGEVERIDPKFPGLHVLLGKTYDRMSGAEPDEALKAFQRAVELQPADSEAYYYLGTVYEQQSMEQEAIDAYRKAIESGVERIQQMDAVVKAHLQLGRIYKKREKEKAKQYFRQALNIDPAAAEVMSELRNIYRQEAESYEFRDEYDNAAEKYKEMLAVNPNDIRNVEILLKLGDIYRSSELYDKAAAMYEAAVRLDPFNFDASSALMEIEQLKSAGSEEE